MKNCLSNILIIIAIIGIFSPAPQVTAQPIQFGIPKGTCVSTSGGIKYDVPKSDCTGFGNNWTQTSNGSSIDTTTGSCTTNNGLNKVYGVTHTNCPSPGVWTPEETAPTSSAFNKDNTHYTLLAPLPGLKEPLDVSGNAALGKYLNIVITLIIGISAVLAMVMIVMGGVQYMTSELVSSKEAGKNRITSAIFGLILALGSFLLLNTINPDLLKTDFSSVGDVTVNVALQDVILSDTGNPPGVTSGCAAGIQKTTIGMFACGNIVQNINNMISAAKNSGLRITGGGYRSLEEQKQLRIKHCDGDFTNAAASCKPPTALPGLSNHNHGKAFDLQCDGAVIQTHDNKCFLWLQANAGTFGLANLPSEPWHWSVDGR